ncbi:MAG: FAD-dependent oxidoreductase, partial [Alphaproteobacteria bacterium]|nr:FAD-dependent oxidoreductase [Alphaproteobacteria bacterium]
MIQRKRMARIAIIGSGISGLAAAYLLHSRHEITVYEKDAAIGGHSRTIEVNTPAGKVPVDTGFIVFNHRNYPLLTRLFDHLSVPTRPAGMSFAASIGEGWLEYSTLNLASLFGQRQNLLRPGYWKMLADILRFYREAPRYLEDDSHLSLGQCLS